MSENGWNSDTPITIASDKIERHAYGDTIQGNNRLKALNDFNDVIEGDKKTAQQPCACQGDDGAQWVELSQEGYGANPEDKQIEAHWNQDEI